jgi:hypothetical protein
MDEMDEFFADAIRQIKVVLKYFNANSTPFCIQAIVDDQNQVNLLDFNFGFGKSYALLVRQRTPEYIIDRIKYTYGGADSIPTNTTYLMNLVFDTPNSISDELKEYIKDKPIFFAVGMGRPDAHRDFVVETMHGPLNIYYRYRSICVIVGSSREEAQELHKNLSQFISTLN